MHCKAQRCYESQSRQLKNEDEKIFPRFTQTDCRYPHCLRQWPYHSKNASYGPADTVGEKTLSSNPHMSQSVHVIRLSNNGVVSSEAFYLMLWVCANILPHPMMPHGIRLKQKVSLQSLWVWVCCTTVCSGLGRYFLIGELGTEVALWWIISKTWDWECHSVLEGDPFKPSLIPRLFPPPVFDRLQYANTEREGLGDLVMYGYVR